MKKESNKDWLFWTPRIIAILFILFLALFSFDIFDLQLGFWGTIVGLLMHNIPSIILTIVLVLSWKKGTLAGYVFIGAGILYILLLAFGAEKFEWYMLSYSMIIAGPAFLTGYLFLMGSKKRLNKK